MVKDKGVNRFFLQSVCEILGDKVKNLGLLIALGTHPLMTEEKIEEFLNISGDERKNRYGKFNIFNHMWNLPETFKTIGAKRSEQLPRPG